MNLEKYQDKEIIFVTPNSTKMDIIKENSNLFLKIKYMNLNEYKEKYFFSYDNKTIDYIMTKYNYNLDFAREILSNLYVIDIERDYSSEKLNLLKDIKIDLVNNNYLKFDLLFREYLKNKLVIVYNYPMLEKYEEEMFKDAVIVKQETKKIGVPVYHCKTLEDEVLFVAEEVIKLVKRGVSLDNIVIANASSEYLYTLYKIFSYYNIPINIDLNESLYGTSIVKKYLLDKTLPGFINPVVKNLVNVINSLVDLEDSPNYTEFLIDKLKSTKLTSKKYSIAITVDNDIPIVDSETHLFLLGFNQDVLPRSYKDEDYISDDLKTEVSLYISKEKNIFEKNRIIKLISNTKNIYLSYKDVSNFDTYLKSSVIDDLNLKVIDYIPNITNSNFYNTLVLGKDLDNYYKYKVVSSNLKKLISHYDILYNSYDNKFSDIEKSDLYKAIDSNLKVSYTSLNSYYECKFKYFIKYILKIDPYKENFSTVIGNLFHYIFSVMDDELFNFEREWNNYLEKLDLSIKEKYFIDNLKEDLTSDIRIIKEQELLTSLRNKKYEQEINIKLDKEINTNLVGKVDKIIYDNIGGENLVGIVDYKTGSITTNINNLKYGLSMQLPIYLYLIHKSNLFTNSKIVGIYLQKVLESNYSFDSKKTKDDKQRDSLRLQGYSTSELDRLSVFDKSYENSELIKGMKIKKDGSFSGYAKVLSDEDFSNIITYTDKKINEAVDSILNGDFSIDPKVIDKDNVSCKYCKYRDICFMNNKDLVYLEKSDDLSFLGGDSNGMD